MPIPAMFITHNIINLQRLSGHLYGQMVKLLGQNKDMRWKMAKWGQTSNADNSQISDEKCKLKIMIWLNSSGP